MQTQVKDVEKGMIIDDGDGDPVVVSEVWNQGRGLGVVIKGTHIDDGVAYFRRFLDEDRTVEVTGRSK